MLGWTGALRQRQAVHRLPVGDRGIAPPARFVLLDAQVIADVSEPLGVDMILLRGPGRRHAVDRRHAAIIARDQLVPQRLARMRGEAPGDMMEPQQEILVAPHWIGPAGLHLGRVLIERVRALGSAIEADAVRVGAVIIARVPFGPRQVADPRTWSVMVSARE